ncbi:MAG: hypothetical protein HC944_02940 [Nanoarchaeota archaeon]|nr:hypothetical protein [Nanoarchaeota archaeon]
MASFYHALFIPAILNGLFLAIATKTGIDFSPSGIGLIIFDVFQPFVSEPNVMFFRGIEIILLLLPWISYVLVVIKFGIRGLVVFGIILLMSFGIFHYFLN